MGFFSFRTTDTGESIPNRYSDELPIRVVMIDNKGNQWISDEDYEGYGIFGGKDIFELIAEMNGKTTRDEGIDLFYSKEKILTPNLLRYPEWHTTKRKFKSWIYTRISPSSTTAYELQHRCQTSCSNVGFGNGSGDQWTQESNGDTYCMVIILKEN